MAFDWDPVYGISGGAAAVVATGLAVGAAAGRWRARSHQRVIRQERFNQLPDQMDRMVTAIEGVHDLDKPVQPGLIDKIDSFGARLAVVESKIDQHLAAHA